MLVVMTLLCHIKLKTSAELSEHVCMSGNTVNEKPVVQLEIKVFKKISFVTFVTITFKW